MMCGATGGKCEVDETQCHVAGERRCVASGQMPSVSCSAIYQCFGSSVN